MKVLTLFRIVLTGACKESPILAFCFSLEWPFAGVSFRFSDFESLEFEHFFIRNLSFLAGINYLIFGVD